jgi:hypothetical protein
MHSVLTKCLSCCPFIVKDKKCEVWSFIFKHCEKQCTLNDRYDTGDGKHKSPIVWSLHVFVRHRGTETKGEANEGTRENRYLCNPTQGPSKRDWCSLIYCTDYISITGLTKLRDNDSWEAAASYSLKKSSQGDNHHIFNKGLKMLI